MKKECFIRGMDTAIWQQGRAAALKAGIPWGEWLAVAIVSKVAEQRACEENFGHIQMSYYREDSADEQRV